MAHRTSFKLIRLVLQINDISISTFLDLLARGTLGEYWAR